MNILHLHEQQSISHWKNSAARAVKEFYGILWHSFFNFQTNEKHQTSIYINAS